ncbi:hypothetical protein H6781_00185 [Candidatus Nomurabacteria bacterium]|nr:hypothetical protein [Candidatus Nomurabacteria bacterium]
MFSKVSSLLLFIVLAVFVAPNYSNAETKTVIIYGDTGDGEVTTAPYPGTWSLQHSRLVGREANYTNDHFRVLSGSFYTPTNYLGIVRAFLTFDTSVIPTEATIVDAKINLFATRKLDDFNDELAYVSLLQGFQQSTSSIVNSDVTLCGDTLVDPKKLSGDVDISDIELSKYQEFVLNGDGIDWINKDGYTKLCLREGHDIENIETVKNENTGTWYESTVIFKSSESQDLSNRPYLEIRYNVPSDQNPYPLYTQIESPYPSVEETAGWEDDVYANGDDGLCYSKTGNGNTVGECGCVITSLVMSGRNAGVEKDILGDDVNPSNMNDYLESVNGYTEDGAIRWLAGSAYLGKLNSSGKITSRFASAPTRPVSEGSTMNFIDQALTEGGNIVLAYSGGHFVWLPEKTSDSYLVRDPWWYETETADQDNLVGETYVRDYNNSFSDARVIKISDEPTEFSGNDIEVHARGTVELLYEKATGEKVGFSDDSVVVDLENASYGDIEIISLAGDENSTGKHLLVYGAGEDFTIKVIGTRNGEYSLEFFTINEFGEVTTFKFSGEIEEGDIRIYTVDLETGEMELVDEEEEEEADLDREAFVALVEEATEDSRKNVQRFFVRVANRIFDSIEKDRNKLAQLQLKVFKKLLKAKKINDSELSEAIDEIGNSLR